MTPVVARLARGAGFAVLAAGFSSASVVAAEPSASPLGGDPRSPGEGPGLVGDPLFAIAVVVAIAIVAIVATLAWIRATADRGADRRPH